MQLPGRPLLCLTNPKMMSPVGGGGGRRPAVTSAACLAPPHWGNLTDTEEQAQAAWALSCIHRKWWEESHFDQQHLGDSFPSNRQATPIHNNAHSKVGGRIYSSSLTLSMFKSRVIFMWIIWCLFSDHLDAKGLLSLNSIYSTWVTDHLEDHSIGYPFLGSPIQTNEKCEECIFSSERDETSQEHIDRMLAG